MSNFSIDRGVTIRVPSTANLMIDSADRPNPTITYANDLQITRNYSLQNGFFTRIGATEVTLEWFQPNISGTNAQRTFTWDLSGGSGVTGTNTGSAVAPIGFYTAADLIDWVVAQLNTTSASFTPNVTWAASTANGIVRITPNNNIYAELSGPITDKLNINTGGFLVLYTSTTPLFVGAGVDLRPCRYIDFVSEQLTYCQDVKDGSTNSYNRNVLVRWYFAYDTPPELDAYGLPILMGYSAFTLRRLYNPPKQIKWDTNQVVGNLSFQLYDNTNSLVNLTTPSTNWLMTLQLSEV